MVHKTTYYRQGKSKTMYRIVLPKFLVSIATQLLRVLFIFSVTFATTLLLVYCCHFLQVYCRSPVSKSGSYRYMLYKAGTCNLPSTIIFFKKKLLLIFIERSLFQYSDEHSHFINISTTCFTLNLLMSVYV